MKGKVVFMGIVSICALAALLFTACPTGSDDNGSSKEPSNVSYTITFKAGAGNGTPPAQQKVTAGTVITLPEQGSMIPPKDLTFAGWKTGEKTYKAQEPFTVNADTGFTARWSVSYTVTFKAGTGTGTPPAQQTVASGAVITLPEQGSMSAPEGKTFDGWETGDHAYAAKASFTVTKDTEFIAQWKSIIDANKTYVEFDNLEQFPATIYSDPSRQTEIARVPAEGKKLIESEPKPQGTVFYPRFLLEFEGIPLDYNGTTIMIRVDEKKVNKAKIPKLDSIETGSAFVKIENKSDYSLTFNRGNLELSPLGTKPSIIMPGESAAYRIEPGAASLYKVMKGGNIPFAFPSQVFQFEAEQLYVFAYSGNAFTLSSAVEVLQALTMLSSPSSVNVSVVSASSINLTWAAVENASSYKVYRSSALDGEYEFLATVSASPYTGGNLSAGTAYYYKVQALNAERESPLSAVGTILILPVVQDISAQVESATSISLSWSATTGAGEYKVYRSTSPDTNFTVIETVSGLTYTDQNLSAGTTYYYKVQAVNTDTAGASSFAEITARILPAPQPAVHVESASSISLTWAAVAGASSYKVYRSSSSDTGFSVIETVSALTYTDENLSAGTTYYYKVQAVNTDMAGASVLSAGIAINILPTPQSVQMQAVSSASSISLTWAATTGASSYKMYRSTSPDADFAVIETVSALTYTDENLSAGTTYYYKVQAVNTDTAGASALSAGISARVLPAPQPAVHVESASSISLTWATVEGASSYKVYRSSSSDTGFEVVETVSAPSYTGQDLSEGITYYYKVQAVDSQGDGILSAGVPVKILPTPQQVQSQVASSASSMNLTWAAVEGASSYKVYRSTSPDARFAVVGTVSDPSYTDQNLSAGTTYYYKVQAVNTDTAGASALSSQVSATTPLPYYRVATRDEMNVAIQAVKTQNLPAFTIALTSSFSLDTVSLSRSGNSAVLTITSESTGEKTLSLSSLNIGSGVSLVLEANVTLEGLDTDERLVQIAGDGVFTMKAGSKVHGNSGGGVCVNGGTFTMNGGEISGNSTSSSSSIAYGGGVYVSGGTFTMNGGEISGNSVSFSGGGVYMKSGVFTMNGGAISGNSVSSSSSVISSVFGGGGVYVYGGTFTMSGGIISDNTASGISRSGGGVYVGYSGIFTKEAGGVIYGSDGGDLKNKATYGKAVCVWKSSNIKYQRNSTAGEGVLLDSTKGGGAGGWE